MPQTTTTQIPGAQDAFFDRKLLERGVPYLLHTEFGQKRPLPTKSTKIIRFRRYNALTAATTPLTEGTTPSSIALAVTDATATVAQYGAYVELSDVVDATSLEAVQTEAAEVLGEQAGQSVDIVARDILVAGTNVLYTNGSARANVNTVISAAILDKTIRQLQNNNAKYYVEMSDGSTKINTYPVRPTFVAIVHPDVFFTLQGVSGFKSVEEYAAGSKTRREEVGIYKNIRFFMSTQAKIFAGAGATGGTSVKETSTLADVYSTLIFGTDAYGVIDLRGHAMATFRKGFGSAGTADPLDQRATIGWKAWTTTRILNDAFMTRIESAATA